MEVLNLSAESLGKIYSWLPHGLEAEKTVVLPDVCPGKAPLPTGTTVLTHQQGWRKFAVSDCGCGMRLLRSEFDPKDLCLPLWDDLADTISQNKGGLGDLGGGNHFLDALVPIQDGPLHFLVHTGSRNESGLVDDLVNQPGRFDQEFCRVVQWAADNRRKVQEAIESVFGPQAVVLDLPHNTYEIRSDGGVLIRKGSVQLSAGELNVIPSHMSGDVALVRATDRISEALDSMSHGTGRTMSRSDCKPLADQFDFSVLRKNILIPTGVHDSSLRTEGPYAYRNLDECLMLLEGFVEVQTRFRVVAYMGHL